MPKNEVQAAKRIAQLRHELQEHNRRYYEEAAPSIGDRDYDRLYQELVDLETQFPQLKPNKSGTGQRLYRKREVELALDIKRLVHDEGYTIAGARQALDSGNRRGALQPAAAPAAVAPPAGNARSEPDKAAILRVKSELREIVALLASAPAARRERPKLVRVRSESDSLFPM